MAGIMRCASAVALVVVFASAVAATGETLQVPSPQYPTIQSAINAAQNGDTVQVAEGTYYESLRYDEISSPTPRSIKLRGAGPPNYSIVDPSGGASGGGPGGRGLEMYSVPAGASVEGFRFTFAYQGSTAATRGGLYLNRSHPTVANNVIEGNHATDGGGLALEFAQPTLTGNVIRGNTATYGGGIHFRNSNATVTNNTIEGNTATQHGGGLRLFDSQPTLVGNAIAGNTGSNSGGGVYMDGYSPKLINNVITGNFSSNLGAGVFVQSGAPILTNNTIADNDGEGVYNNGAGTVTITNCIVWGNSLADLRNYGSGQIVPTYCDVGTSSPAIVDPAGKHDISVEPEFLGAAQGYRLPASSPCVNAGNNSAPDLPATDKDGNPRTAGGTIDLGAYENRASVAAADSYAVNEDASLTVPPDLGVLANDSDPENDPLSAVLVTNVAHGELTLNAKGSFTYLPASNFHGTDSFTYKANDGAADSNVATVTLTVNAVNDAPSFSRGTDQTVLEDAGAQSVSGWATGISPGPLNESAQAVAFLVSNDSNALFSIQPAIAPDGTLTYTPALNTNGTATVTVRLQDDGGTANGGVDTSPPQTFTITVTAVNDPPSFTMGSDQTVLEDAGPQTVAGSATAISPGPPDEAAQKVTFLVSNDNIALFSSPPAIASDGTLTYTPAPNAKGIATVTVQAQDDGGTANGGVDTSLPQTLTITVTAVNHAPVAANDSYSVNENETLTIAAAEGVLANDSDVDGDPLKTILVTGPTHGGLTLNADGSFTYTPELNFYGADVFTYRASDGALTSSTAAVTIAVIGGNQPPTADGDGPYMGVEDDPVHMDGSASRDPENAALTYRWDFGDGTTAETMSTAIEHTYLSAGIYTVVLVVFDGELTSAPYSTEATIGARTDNQRDDVDAFLTYAQPTAKKVELPTGTTTFHMIIIYGPTINANTFTAKLDGKPFAGFHPAPDTAETVTIPMNPKQRNTNLALSIKGLRADGKQATDKDSFVFHVPKK